MQKWFLEDYVDKVTKFLWMPKMVSGEVRWLEKATMERTPWPFYTLLGMRFRWIYTEFMD
jgi:hypothetical protein